MMREPWEGDPDNLLELNFRRLPAQEELAASAVAAAVAELKVGYPSNPRADAKLRERASRVFAAWSEGFQLIELAVNEYLTREAMGGSSLGLSAVTDEAENLKQKLADFQVKLGQANNRLTWSEINDGGAEVADSIAWAHDNVMDAYRSLAVASMALATAARHMPVEKRGQSGALGKLHLPSDVAMYEKIAAMWEVSGLSIKGGDGGDGLDVFIYHALKAADPKKVASANWLSKLREKIKPEMSTKNVLPELP